MDTTVSPRGTPEAPAAATIPSEAPAATDRSLQQPQDLTAKAKSASSPNEVRALIAQSRAAMESTIKGRPDGIKKDSEVTPAANIPPDLAAAAAAEETPAATTETTPAEETPVDQSSETAEDEGDQDADDGGDGPIEPVSGKRTHLRISQDDKVGRLAAAFMKRNRDMPMSEALDRARNQLGIKPQEAEAETPTQQSNLPQTIEDVDAAIKEARAKRKQANTELRFEEASDLSDQLEDLIQHRFTIERETERKQVAQASAYDQQFSASETRAIDLYEFAGKPESEGGKRMLEIEADLKANDDPLYSSPDKPLRIAQMVAAELKIAPRRKGAPAAPAKAAAPAAVQAPKKQVLPGGGSRTTPPPVNQPPAIDARVKAIRNPYELRQLRKDMGLPR